MFTLAVFDPLFVRSWYRLYLLDRPSLYRESSCHDELFYQHRPRLVFSNHPSWYLVSIDAAS